MTQTCNPAPPQRVAPRVHWSVQHDAFGAAPKHAPLGHVDVDDGYQQPIESWPQVASVVPLSHAKPWPLHVAFIAQVHMAVPALPPPVQVWCGPHATGAFHEPLLLHVWGPIVEHVVEPGVHWPWHTPEHAPQTPAPLQNGSAMGHATGALHAPLVQVSTPLPEQRFAPDVHTAASLPGEGPSPVVTSAGLPLSVVVTMPVSPVVPSVIPASALASGSLPLPVPALKSPSRDVQAHSEQAETKATRIEARDMLVLRTRLQELVARA